MKKNLFYIGIPIAILMLSTAVRFTRSETSLQEYYRGPEALEWLETNKNPRAFASNRFESTRDAIRFVEALYSKGARSVTVSQRCIKNEPARIEAEGGPYAYGMAVLLPEDETARAAVLDLCRGQIDPAYRDDLERNIVDGMVFLWWD